MSLARRVGAFVFTFLLVSTAMTSGVVPGSSSVGTASAELSDECTLLGIGDGWELAYNTLTGGTDGCYWVSGSTADYDNISQTDAYASSLSVHDGVESYGTTTQNFAQDTRSVAWSKAKLAIVQELNNGSSASVAKTRANETIEAYYSQVQYNLIQDWNNRMRNIQYIHEANNNYTLVNTNNGGNETLGEFYTMQTILANGSEVETVVATSPSGSGGTDAAMPLSFAHTNQSGFSGRQPSFNGTGYYVYNEMTIRADDPSLGGDQWTTLLDYNDDSITGGWENRTPYTYNLVYDQFAQQNSQVRSNVGPYVDSVYQEYAQGDLNTTDIVANDPAIIANNAATEYNSTGYYSFAAVQLAALGANGDLNTSHTVEVYTNATLETTYNGTLFYTGDDATDFVTGSQYNLSNHQSPDLNGSVYFVVQPDNTSKSSYIRKLGDDGNNFVIIEATDTDTGESVNTTQTQTYVYDSTNATALQEEIDRLKELRLEYEEAIESSSGSSSGSGLSTEVIGGAILVGAAAVLLIQREGRQ